MGISETPRSLPVTRVEFRLFGAMALQVDGAPAGLPGPAERRLLALLLLSPGRTVPAATLMDRLWSGGVLPDDPRNALQLRVSKLRRALARVGLDVHREATGYRVDVDPDAVDLHVFTRRIHAARAEVAGGGPSAETVPTRRFAPTIGCCPSSRTGAWCWCSTTAST